MAGRGRRSVFRVLLFLLIVLGLFFAVGGISELLFAPKLTLVGSAVPAGVSLPDVPVTVGVYARNERTREGAAYALLILQDGTEIEGPVVIVPPEDSVLVPVQVSLPAGDHVATLVLYDAWRENVEVAAVHGVLLRSGEPQVDVVSAALPPVVQPGGAILVELTLANRAEWDATVAPLVVFTPEPGGEPLEASLGRVAVPGGQTLTTSRSIPPGSIPQGRYLVSVVNLTDAGERTGDGVHGIPFSLPSLAPPGDG
jgi:hypothetical protein